MDAQDRMSEAGAVLSIAAGYHRLGAFHEAARLCGRILDDRPSHVGARHLLGLGAYQSGHVCLAVVRFRHAIATHPGYGAAYAALARALLDLEDASVALGVARLAAACGGGPSADAALAVAARRLGRPAEALAAQERGIVAAPQVPAGHANRASLLIALGQREAARPSLLRALALRPGAADAWAALAVVLPDARRRLLGHALWLAPSSAVVRHDLATSLEALDPTTARRAFREALAVDPGLAEAYAGLARLATGRGPMASGGSGDVVRFLTRAEALAPDNVAILNNLGGALLVRGERRAARGRLERALRLDPRSVDATNNLAGAVAEGDTGRAVVLRRRAAALAPAAPLAFNGLGLALHERGSLIPAGGAFASALWRQPAYVEAWLNLAALHLARRRTGDARAAGRRALSLRPGDPRGWARLGHVADATGDGATARRLLRRTIALSPADRRARIRLSELSTHAGEAASAHAEASRAVAIAPDDAEADIRLAEALAVGERRDEAAVARRRAYRKAPHLPSLQRALGAAAERAERPIEALAAYHRAAALAPASAEAYGALARMLRGVWRTDEGLAATRHALFLRPGYAAGHVERASLLTITEALAAAEHSFLRALSLSPGDDRIRFNMSFPLLKAGRLAEGWRLYDCALGDRRPPWRSLPMPRWRGEDLTGKRIFVESEQGIGDEIRFASCFSDLLRRVDGCAISTDPRLGDLFRRSFPTAAVVERHGGETVPAADFWTPAGSLPRYLRPTADSFPVDAGYLVPDPGWVQRWRDRLAALPSGPRIGIAWRSRRMMLESFADITAIEMWREVLTVPGAVFVNLQYDRAEFEVALARERFGVEIHAWPDVDLMTDLDAAVALAAVVDVGISVCVSVNDQLGAVGTECWLLWRGATGAWGGNRHPFYPNHRILTRRHDEPAAVSLAKAATLLRGRVAAWRRSARDAPGAPSP